MVTLVPCSVSCHSTNFIYFCQAHNIKVNLSDKYPEFEDIPYEEYSEKEILMIPVGLLLLSIVIFIGSFALTGTPIQPGLEFTGGTEVRVDTQESVGKQTVRQSLPVSPESVVSVPGTNSYILTFESGSVQTDRLEQSISQTESIELEQVSEISPSLGKEAQVKGIIGLLIAFVLMSGFVIVTFRSFIPAVAVIASAIIDITVPLAAMQLVGIELSQGTIGALLMLIGYSVDSDILLNNAVLRTSKTFYNSVKEAMRTGITMNITSFSAVFVMTIISSIYRIDLLADIGFILSVGLITDIVNTYLMNFSILRWHTQGD